MDRAEWELLTKQFLHHREYSERTREAYGHTLRGYLDWCFEVGLAPEKVTQADLLDYQEVMAQRMARGTVVIKFRNLKSFYGYLQKTGVVIVSPAVHIASPRDERVTRNVLTLDELDSMWNASHGRDRVIIGLLALCSLRRAELRDARVEDLHWRGETRYLALPERTRRHEFDHVAIPAQLAREIDDYLGGRRTGLLIEGNGADGRVATTLIRDAVQGAAKRAKVPFRVTTLSLTFTLRALALEQRFSYLSVVRSASETDTRRLVEMVRHIELYASEHASIRLGRMLAARSSPDEEMLLRADVLLADRSQHPAASIVVAGATLERALREVSDELGIIITNEKPTIKIYAMQLKTNHVISSGQFRTLDQIGGVRNDAAHGYFELVDRRQAEWVLSESRQLITHLREVALQAAIERSA